MASRIIMKDAADVRISAQVLFPERISRLVISILRRTRGPQGHAMGYEEAAADRELSVLGVDHVARDGFELGERGDVLQIPRDIRIFPEGFDVRGTAPLRIDEHA